LTEDAALFSLSEFGVQFLEHLDVEGDLGLSLLLLWHGPDDVDQVVLVHLALGVGRVSLHLLDDRTLLLLQLGNLLIQVHLHLGDVVVLYALPQVVRLIQQVVYSLLTPDYFLKTLHILQRKIGFDAINVLEHLGLVVVVVYQGS
jgi:hypothetical protein